MAIKWKSARALVEPTSLPMQKRLELEKPEGLQHRLN
jgi:hypothetical protein